MITDSPALSRRSILGLTLAAAMGLSACTPTKGCHTPEHNDVLKKEAIFDETNPDRYENKDRFARGLKLSGHNELLWVSGSTALRRNGKVAFPKDAGAQMRLVLEEMDNFLAQAGYTKHDVVYFDVTVTKNVGEKGKHDVLSALDAWMADVNPKPSAGTYKAVDSLVLPDLKVELELVCASSRASAGSSSR